MGLANIDNLKLLLLNNVMKSLNKQLDLQSIYKIIKKYLEGNLNIMNNQQALISISKMNTKGLTWSALELLLEDMEQELHFAEKQFHNEVQDIKNRDLILHETRESLNSLKDMITRYTEDLDKIKAYDTLIQERLVSINDTLGKLETIEYDPCYINKERKCIYENLEKFYDNYIEDIQSMNQYKKEVINIDNQIEKMHGIKNIKTNLNTLFNLLSFLKSSAEYLESNTENLIQQHDKLLNKRS